jgi:hypothetical protein
MKSLFSWPPTGRLRLPRLAEAVARLAALEERLASVERQLETISRPEGANTG